MLSLRGLLQLTSPSWLSDFHLENLVEQWFLIVSHKGEVGLYVLVSLKKKGISWIINIIFILQIAAISVFKNHCIYLRRYYIPAYSNVRGIQGGISRVLYNNSLNISLNSLGLPFQHRSHHPPQDTFYCETTLTQ